MVEEVGQGRAGVCGLVVLYGRDELEEVLHPLGGFLCILLLPHHHVARVLKEPQTQLMQGELFDIDFKAVVCLEELPGLCLPKKGPVLGLPEGLQERYAQVVAYGQNLIERDLAYSPGRTVYDPLQAY